MKVLIINKFLHPNGGSETYVFQIGEWLTKHGHEVQYFGMDNKERCVGNNVGAYTSEMNFHSKSKVVLASNAFKTIYSIEARKKIKRVLDDFDPDVCHLNNFNYQLTPSVILEIVKWRKERKKRCRIIYTAHDYQLVCPNHMCNNPNTHKNCEKCFGGHYINSVKNKCIHGSLAKSIVGAMEAWYWNKRRVYKYIDKIICCSNFLKEKLDSNPVLKERTLAMHNFSCKSNVKESITKKDYILYFGRYSSEKGIKTLIEACKKIPEEKFVFAGKGPLKEYLNEIKNIEDVGFKKGVELEDLIRKAKFSIYPAEWYENCPFSVMESQILGTPVLGANIGGIPELIQDGETGELFESGNVNELVNKIRNFPAEKYREKCLDNTFYDIEVYCDNLLNIYMGVEV